MRLLAIILAVGIVALQWPLWIGKGSWLKVFQIESQVAQQRNQNAKLTARNAALDAEVHDLKTGTDAIEERARNELGMIRQDEVFYQILETHAPAGTLSGSASHQGTAVNPSPTATEPAKPASAPVAVIPPAAKP